MDKAKQNKSTESVITHDYRYLLHDAFFNYAPDPIMIISYDGYILDANQKTLEILEYDEKEIKSLHMLDISVYLRKLSGKKKPPDLHTQPGEERIIQDNLLTKSGREVEVEAHIKASETNGNIYSWVTLRDISKQKHAEKKQKQKLEEASLIKKFMQSLIESPNQEDIYNLLNKYLLEILPGSIITISTYYPEEGTLTLSKTAGLKTARSDIMSLIKHSPVNMRFPLSTNYYNKLLSSKLINISDSIHPMAETILSESLARRIEKLINFGSAYAMGISKDSHLYGSVVILIPRGSEMHKKELIQTLIRQASVAIQRSYFDRELSKKKGLLSRTEEISHVGTWEYDLKSEKVIWSEELYRIYGLKPESTVIDSNIIRKLIHPDDLQRVEGTLLRSKLNSNNYNIEFRIITPEGEVRHILNVIEVLRDENGRPEKLSGISVDQSRQKESEIKLKKTIEKYESVVNNAIEAIFVVQGDSFRFMNPTCMELTGYTYEEFISYKFMDLVHPDDRELVVERNRCRLQGADFPPYDIRFKKKDGSMVWISLNATKIEWEGKDAILCFATDISERKKAEKELARSRQELNQFLSAADDMVYVQNLEGNYTLLNNYLEKLGYEMPAGKLRLDYWLENIHPDDRSRIIYFFDKEAGKKERHHDEYRVKDAWGNWHWFDLKMVAQKDDKNKITGYYCIDRDITTQKENQEKLVKAKKRAELNARKNQSLLEAIPDMMFLFDSNGIIVDSHTGHENNYLVPGEKFLKQNIHDVLPADLAQLTAHKIRLTLETNKNQIYNYTLNENGQESIFEARMVCVDKNHVITIVRDITERNRMIAELEQAKEKAEESDRMKSAFLAAMSHELRTPLNAIIGFSELIKSNDFETRTREFSNIILSNGKHLLELINSILNISSLEAGDRKLKIKPTNIPEFAGSIFSVLKSEIVARGKSHIKTIFTPDGSLDEKVILIDNTKVKQILVNLLSNAVKFTNKGFVEFGYYHENDSLHFYVKDTGIGISKQDMNLIFEQFRQLDSTDSYSTDGVGLGLSISKKLAELIGAKIEVSSDLHHGTTFVLILPQILTYEEDAPESIAKKTNPKKSAEKLQTDKQLNILIAEDEDSNFMLIDTLLQSINCRVIRAENGQKAVDLFKSHSIDIVLMDMKMPIKSGYEASKEIKTINKDVPVVAVTAYAMHGDEKRALDAGCDYYITKPVNKNKLFSTLNEITRKINN